MMINPMFEGSLFSLLYFSLHWGQCWLYVWGNFFICITLGTFLVIFSLSLDIFILDDIFFFYVVFGYFGLFLYPLVGLYYFGVFDQF